MNALVVMSTAIFALAGALTAEPQAASSQRWVPAVYHGLIVGKSNRADVLRVLGKPTSAGKGGEVGIPYISYDVSDPTPGTLTVYIRRGIIHEMDLKPKAPTTKKDIIRVFGSDYRMVRYSVDDCLNEGGVAPVYEDPDGPIEQMEYRPQGIAVSFDLNEVEVIAFVARGEGPTHSRCPGTSKAKRK